jgi:pyrroloquinoline quinone biosynthesis protein B
MIILGTAQDGGYPQMGCTKKCCQLTSDGNSKKQFVVSLALVDHQSKQWWLFEATPDIKEQLHLFAEVTNHEFNFLPKGIFITHAHIGHYTGLMQLGKEVMNAQSIPVYAMPGLKKFLETNGPWSQLVMLKNISLNELHENTILKINNTISIQSIKVPHRDEFSETVGFKIVTPTKKYLFIPDIDKWSKWNSSIINEVKSVDIAYLDATFHSSGELPNRNMIDIPHPFVSETMDLFEDEKLETKNKINFIHFNHTNPLLYDSMIQNEVSGRGYNFSKQVLPTK